MRFCVNCGTALDPGAAFCTACGTRVAAAPAPTPNEEPTQMAPAASAHPGMQLPRQRPAVQDDAAQASATTPDDTSFDDDATRMAPTSSAAPTQEVEQQDVVHDDVAQQDEPAAQSFGARWDEASATPASRSFSDAWQSHDAAAQSVETQPITPAAPAPAAATQPIAHQQPVEPTPAATYTQPMQTQAPAAPHVQQAQQAPVTPQQYTQPVWQSAPAGAPSAPRSGLAFDWKALLPGLLRIVAAIALSMTALGNWWVITDHEPATHTFVLPLIGCIGVTLAAVVQIALLPQLLGQAVPAMARLGVRAALCLPALVAVIMAIVTTLGGADSDKFTAFGVTLLAMAIGFALVGFDEDLPHDALKWGAVAVAGLGIVLTVLSLIQGLGADSFPILDGYSGDLAGKTKWLTIVPSMLFIIAIAGLVIWAAVARPAIASGLLAALAIAVVLSALTRGWISGDSSLFAVAWMRNGHGAPLVALALALASATRMTRPAHDTATDDGSKARRMTAWVVPGYAVAAAAAVVNALTYIAARDDYTPGGATWFLVLMIITALAYGACAYLLKSHAAGRLVAVITSASIALTILITIAAAKNSMGINEIFTEAAYLWLPLLAAGALTIPPSVRAVAGSMMPARPQGTQAPQASSTQQWGAPAQNEPIQWGAPQTHPTHPTNEGH